MFEAITKKLSPSSLRSKTREMVPIDEAKKIVAYAAVDDLLQVFCLHLFLVFVFIYCHL